MSDAAGAGVLAALELGEHAERVVALHLELGPDAAELLPHHRALDERPAVAPQRLAAATRRWNCDA